jgi:hypothetical protein
MKSKKRRLTFRAATDVRQEIYHRGKFVVETPTGARTIRNNLAFMWVEDL